MTIFEILQQMNRHDLHSGWTGGDMVREDFGDWINLDLFLEKLVTHGLITQEQSNSFWGF